MSLHYACTALVGRNKTGNLTPDENGYYKLCLGALNFHNSAGIYYDYESSKHIFEGSSSFMRRMGAGNLHSEEDHPAWPPGASQAEYIYRIRFIDSHNVCAHIRDIEVVEEENASLGGKVMVVYGWVKPDRERGPFLEAALKNPKQNVCFSLRALCDDNLINGKMIRTITELVTFDWVIEPGISKAHKYNAPGLEHYSDAAPLQDQQDMEIPLSVLRDAVALTNSRASTVVGCESAQSAKDLEGVLSKYETTTKIKKPSALSQWV